MIGFPAGMTGGSIAGAIMAFLSILAVYLINRRKVRVDESSLVLAKWKELYDAHEKRIEDYERRIESYERRIEAITNEFSQYRHDTSEETRALRERLSTAEDRILVLERTIIDKDKYIDGLEGQIAQITQSSAVILSGNNASDDISSAAERSAEAKGRQRRKNRPDG